MILYLWVCLFIKDKPPSKVCEIHVKLHLHICHELLKSFNGRWVKSNKPDSSLHLPPLEVEYYLQSWTGPLLWTGPFPTKKKIRNRFTNVGITYNVKGSTDRTRRPGQCRRIKFEKVASPFTYLQKIQSNLEPPFLMSVKKIW